MDNFTNITELNGITLTLARIKLCKLQHFCFNTFGAKVAKSRHNGLSAEVHYSRPLGSECCRLYGLSTEVA